MSKGRTMADGHWEVLSASETLTGMRKTLRIREDGGELSVMEPNETQIETNQEIVV